VIIARDEQDSIARCIESLLTSLDGRTAEVLLVDSASTDATIQIASSFPLSIAQLRPEAPMRPSVGRHVGLSLTRAPLILFMDGDSVFDPTWLPVAIAELDADPQLAGVSGAREGRVAEAGGAQTWSEYGEGAELHATHLPGPAMYRRSALAKAGGFNPSMYAFEELELGARLRAAGYRLARLRQRMTIHERKGLPETTAELFRRIRRRFPIGMGQLGRYRITNNLPVDGLFDMLSKPLLFGLLIPLGIVALGIEILGRGEIPIEAWSALLVGLFLVFAWRAASLRKPAYYFLEWTLTGPMVWWGLLRSPLDPQQIADVAIPFDWRKRWGEAQDQTTGSAVNASQPAASERSR
jgi:glycosyltransferase involved in cell wall biosynthesis